MDSFLKIIESNTLRFRKNNYSNDDRDGHILEYINESFELLKNDFNISQTRHWKSFEALCRDSYAIIENFVYKKHLNDHRVPFPIMFNFCLSKEVNEHMWQNYGDGDDGVCIEISRPCFSRYCAFTHTEHKENINKYYACCSSSVIYDYNMKIDCIKSIIYNVYSEYSSLLDSGQKDTSDLFQEFVADVLMCSYFFKDGGKWGNEREYRFILLYYDRKNEIPLREPNGAPYIEISFDASNFLREYIIKKVGVKKEEHIPILTEFDIDCELISN